jgi:hypothetical protein
MLNVESVDISVRQRKRCDGSICGAMGGHEDEKLSMYRRMDK